MFAMQNSLLGKPRATAYPSEVALRRGNARDIVVAKLHVNRNKHEQLLRLWHETGMRQKR